MATEAFPELQIHGRRFGITTDGRLTLDGNKLAGPVSGIPKVNGNLTTVGNGTLTAALLNGKLITRSGPTGAFTDTTDAAATIITAMKGFITQENSAWNIGESFQVTYINTTPFPATIAGGTGVTVSGQTVIADNSAAEILVSYTGAGTVSVNVLYTVDASQSAQESETIISTVGNGVLTAASFASLLITRTGSTAPYTDTTATAAAIITALPDAAIGDAYEVTIRNTVAFPETLSAGVGVTLSGNTVIPPNSAMRCLLTYTAAGAVSLEGLFVSSLDGSASPYNINKAFTRVTSALTATANVVPANITGLSAFLIAGTYKVRAHLPCTSGASGGPQINLATSDTLALTSSDQTAYINNTAVAAAIVHSTAGLGTALGATQVALSVELEATLVVATAGTLNLQGCQNASNATSTVFLVGGTMEITRIA